MHGTPDDVFGPACNQNTDLVKEGFAHFRRCLYQLCAPEPCAAQAKILALVYVQRYVIQHRLLSYFAWDYFII